ncbi:hypothetical protein AAZX31_17G076200 [Glycine max]|uniref:Uncharacterized protein n=2 Tax=Glycine subgen. Soja TaxID=1462606 RepID=K7MKI0_SOYBN|nr:uncharacterized protein LOC102660994 [Glycine max]XP_028209070.1 uncharacterized protein LOC114392217 [Glycine soja]KAG4929822.1 hypothetical protein JHK86_046783 [Glycine max]KAG4942703.1 hypothetical protein JHK85_047349 [Glycine max]KAG5097039.1 hypothetical protein JHK82_046893 [Glycine max]KAG5101825.1 hypothetical protein JHK84_046794 [Glycine max]KAH1117368.1 hypothetical protein GYH30_046593 [Glycine max]|eukprot:XP_014625163.1 uncharacterized protein LOC102660994 [Glycine max]
METGGDNKETGKHDLHQTSQSKEQEHEITNNSHLDDKAHPSSSTPPSQNPSDASESSQNKSSKCETIPTNVESHTPTKSGEDDDVQNSSIIPKHEHGEVAVTEDNQGSSEIQNPPVQVMERPGESGTSPQYVFPSHVFSKSNANSTVEWSTASNESLFSIHMGNMSFSSELVCFKSGELDKSGDVSMHDHQPIINASPPTQQPDAPPAENKFNDISKITYELQLLHEKSSKATEAKAAETMREVIMESSRTTENVGKGDDKASNSCRQSNGSTNSYSFQSSKGRDKSVSSKGAAGEKQNQQKQSEEDETPNAADQAPKSSTNAPNKWLNCFSCFTCCN